MKYYKRYWLPDSPVYYRVYPDGLDITETNDEV